MAKNIYPEELLALLEEFLTDGVITDKERKVLLKKASALGVDTDEFDLYIDAQQQKTDQAIDSSVAKKRGVSCPFCGGPVPLLTDKCPHCGQFVTAEASDELEEIFNKLENSLVNMKSSNDFETSKATVEKYVRKAKIYYGNNPKVKKILSEIESEMTIAQKQFVSEQRNKKTIAFLKSKWAWCLFETIIFAILITIFSVKISDYHELSTEGWLLWSHTNGEKGSLEWHSNEDKEKDMRATRIWTIIGGIIIIGTTATLAIKESKN